jgi:hypothetical protein
MKYIIDEEELLDLIDQYDYNEPNIKDFLKSKTPVEEIAEGEIYDTCMSAIPEYHIGDKNLNHLIEDYQGEKVRIYLGVIK